MSNYDEILEILNMLLTDYSIPRNIKAVLDVAKTVVAKKDDNVVAISEVVYKLQDICDDINLPLSVKPELWMLLTKFELLKESIKK